jgi:hypothetical protein
MGAGYASWFCKGTRPYTSGRTGAKPGLRLGDFALPQNLGFALLHPSLPSHQQRLGALVLRLAVAPSAASETTAIGFERVCRQLNRSSLFRMPQHLPGQCVGVLPTVDGKFAVHKQPAYARRVLVWPVVGGGVAIGRGVEDLLELAAPGHLLCASIRLHILMSVLWIIHLTGTAERL